MAPRKHFSRRDWHRLPRQQVRRPGDQRSAAGYFVGNRLSAKMASIELLYSDIEQLLLSVGASGIRRLTQNIQGHIMATSHWRAVMRYPGQESLQLIEGVKSADGRLVVLSTWADLQQLQQMPGERMTMATNLQDVTPMTLVGIRCPLNSPRWVYTRPSTTHASTPFSASWLVSMWLYRQHSSRSGIC